MSPPSLRNIAYTQGRGVTSLVCILLLATLGALACASAGGAAAQRSACGLRPSDSSFAAAGHVYRDCGVDTKAQAVNPSARIDFQPSTRGVTNCYSAEVEFVVNAAGFPEVSTARVVRANDPSFGEAVLAAVRTWRYQPAIKNGQPVRQIVDERRAAQTAVVVVPAGGAVPTRPPANAPRPNC